MKNHGDEREKWFAIIIFSAEPNGVKVEARLIHIVIPRRIGAGLFSISYSY